MDTSIKGTGAKIMKALIKAANAIASATDTPIKDAEDWASIVNFIELGFYAAAATSFRLMDTYSRDLLSDAARADSNVRAQAAEALSIQWLF